MAQHAVHDQWTCIRIPRASLALVGVVLVLAASLGASLAEAAKAPRAAPAWSPEDYSNYRYLTQVNADWSTSDRFDFEHPVTLDVVIHGALIPDTGLAELLYTVEGYVPPQAPAGFEDLVSPYRRATLQTVEVLKKRGLAHRNFNKGVKATLTGWPATRLQAPYTEMLVDEITFRNKAGKGNGQAVGLHDDHPCLVKFRDKDKPRDAARRATLAEAGIRCPTPLGPTLAESDTPPS